MLCLSISLLVTFLHLAGADDSPPTCGYSACDLGKPGMLNVHIMPHTHDDVGWLKTVNQYYFGDANGIQNAGVQYILDTTIRALLENENRRFIYVEIAFFYRWWNEQTDEMKTSVRTLVNTNRLQFILGGWAMNDEATTHYTAIIDQHTRGLRFLQREFGECGRPLTAWQIDPFGHSREMASLFAQMGYDSLYFARLDYREKKSRQFNKTLEMLWRGSEDIPREMSDLFTGAMYGNNYYCPPSGFCFDQLCSDPPIMDDPRLYPNNVKEKVDVFIAYVQEQAKHYTSNHIMVPMGCDFQFQNAQSNFKNIDKLVKYVNAMQALNSKVNVIYSTPSCYSYAVNQQNLVYQEKKDDFFPYASDNETYWVGYFASRPALKGYVRETNSLLQATQQLSVLSGLSSQSAIDQRVDTLRRAMGVLQHHDAVSGTEKQAVANDYALQLANGINQIEPVISMALSRLVGLEDSNPFHFCHLLNISSCEITESGTSLTMVAYNPMSHTRKHWVRIPVYSKLATYTVQDAKTNRSISVQVVPVTKRTKNIPERKASKADNELVFEVTLPALGYGTYSIIADKYPKVKKSRSRTLTHKQMVMESGGPVVIQNKFLKLTFNPATSILQEMENLVTNEKLSLKQSIQYYISMIDKKGRSSGAYAFRPAKEKPENLDGPVTVNYILGPLVQEVHQYFSNWTSQVIRLYNNSDHVEIEWTVGPIPDKDKQGREVIMNYETNLLSSGIFFTDANGRQMMLREKNKRSYPFNQTEAVAGNYYPITSHIMIGDTMGKNPLQLTVLTDRAQGGGSIHEGQVEMMVHRRCTVDDGFGVGEPLMENGSDGKGLIVRGKHFIRLDNLTTSWKAHRQAAQHIFWKPVLAFAPLSSKPLKRPVWSGLNATASGILPHSVNLMTMDEWNNGSKLIRLEHIYQSQEDPKNLSKPVTVNLKQMFSGMIPIEIVELTLGANQKLSESKRLKWRSTSQPTTNTSSKLNEDFVDPFEIKLSPMQIRTFMVTFQYII